MVGKGSGVACGRVICYSFTNCERPAVVVDAAGGGRGGDVDDDGDGVVVAVVVLLMVAWVLCCFRCL